MMSSLGSHRSLSEVTQEALDLQRKRRLSIPLRLMGRHISLVDRLAVSSSLVLASPKAIF